MRVPQRTMTDATVAATGLGTLWATWTTYVEPLAQATILVGTALLILLRLALGIREWFNGPHPKRRRKQED
jgi:hypothetical protein